MDEWAFLSMAKINADASKARGADAGSHKVEEVGVPKIVDGGLRKIDTAAALDGLASEDSARFRAVVAFAVAVLVNLSFLGAIERNALEARTPAGEVVVAEVSNSQSLPTYARADVEQTGQL